jgi:hypothetical protein
VIGVDLKKFKILISNLLFLSLLFNACDQYDSNDKITKSPIKIVPRLENLDFSIDKSYFKNNNMVVIFDNSNIKPSSKDPIINYVWDWGDKLTSNGIILGVTKHLYAQQGFYGITLSVFTKSGRLYKITKNIFMIDNVNLNISRNDKNVTFSWNDIKGAVKYKLYIYNNKSDLKTSNYDTRYELAKIQKPCYWNQTQQELLYYQF